METPAAPIVVVTGGTAGIGRATVREFARNGYDVAILARGQDGLEGAREDVEGLGRKALAIATDVADWNAVEAEAVDTSAELWISEHKKQLGVALGAAAVAGVGFMLATRSGNGKAAKRRNRKAPERS